MSSLPLMLRILVCLSLVANGIGFAHASVQMQLGHLAVAPTEPPTVAASSHHGCHETPIAQVPTPAKHSFMAHANHGGSSHDADCCKGKACQCDCAYQGTPALATATQTGVDFACAARFPAAAAQYAAPRLPHLIRPPIG